ncbi:MULTISPECIES: hypothetical protein [Clostridium]|jgi:hypothetical protein|nr:hypothetical protein [Clostridium sp. C8]KLE16028.1 hypothetical protein AAT22_08335 [Clostridium sp. C8]
MKKYLKNKNFIPKDFIERLNDNSEKKNNKLITLLIVLNIMFFPTTFNKVIINKKEINEEKLKVEKDSNLEKDIKRENLKYWVNSINSNIINMKIQNSSGIIKIKGEEEVFKIEAEEEFKIKSIIKEENNSFILEVSL